MDAGTALTSAVTLGFIAASQPGPFQAFLLARTVQAGRARTLPLSLVPLASDGPIALIALLVLARAPEGWLRALSLAGAVVVLTLAVEAYRTLRREGAAPTVDATVPSGVGRAILVNVTNPGPWTFWALVLGPLVVDAWRAAPWLAGLVVGGFYVTLVSGLAALILLFSLTARLGARVRFGMQAVSVVALVGFGVWLGVRGVVG